MELHSNTNNYLDIYFDGVRRESIQLAFTEQTNTSPSLLHLSGRCVVQLEGKKLAKTLKSLNCFKNVVCVVCDKHKLTFTCQNENIKCRECYNDINNSVKIKNSLGAFNFYVGEEVLFTLIRILQLYNGIVYWTLHSKEPSLISIPVKFFGQLDVYFMGCSRTGTHLNNPLLKD